jgi:hypothetical protein
MYHIVYHIGQWCVFPPQLRGDGLLSREGGHGRCGTGTTDQTIGSVHHIRLTIHMQTTIVTLTRPPAPPAPPAFCNEGNFCRQKRQTETQHEKTRASATNPCSPHNHTTTQPQPTATPTNCFPSTLQPPPVTRLRTDHNQPRDAGAPRYIAESQSQLPPISIDSRQHNGQATGMTNPAAHDTHGPPHQPSTRTNSPRDAYARRTQLTPTPMPPPPTTCAHGEELQKIPLIG